MTYLPSAKLRLLAAAVTALGYASAANAGAFYLQEQSTRGMGRAFSGEVADTGAASLWWNPAAIGGITQAEGSLGTTALFAHGTVRDTGTRVIRPGQAPASVGGNAVSKNPIDNGILPSGSIAVPLGDRIALGLTVTSPFSFTTNYEDNSWARYTADKTKLRTFDIQPAIGVAVTDWLRVGGALNVEYSKATLNNSIPAISPLLPDGRQELKGDGWDLGWSAGAQVHGEGITMGFSYKSSVKHKLDGSLVVSGLLGPVAAGNMNIGASATFRTPWQAMAGIRYAATDKLTLNGQVVRFGWDKFDAIRLGAPVNQAIPEDYRNSWSFAGGIDYAVTPVWTLRTGLQRDTTPTHDGARDARVPDGSRWNYAAGTSYALNPHVTIDAGASYVKIQSASIDRNTAFYVGTAAQTNLLVSGVQEKSRAILLSLGGRVTF